MPSTQWREATQILTNVDGTLFFAADDGVHGYELWKTKPRIRTTTPRIR